VVRMGACVLAVLACSLALCGVWGAASGPRPMYAIDSCTFTSMNYDCLENGISSMCYMEATFDRWGTLPSGVPKPLKLSIYVRAGCTYVTWLLGFIPFHLDFSSNKTVIGNGTVFARTACYYDHGWNSYGDDCWPNPTLMRCSCSDL